MDDIAQNFDFDSYRNASHAFAIRPALPQSQEAMLEFEKAATSGNIRLAEQLYEAYDVTDVREYFGTSMTLAINNGHLNMVKFLLSKGEQINAADVKAATLRKDKAILEVFLESGWDINEQTRWNVPAALAFAVEDLDLCSWFLAHGANPNSACVLDITPLSAAVQYAPFAVIRMFFEHGGSINCGQLLHYAIWRKQNDRRDIVTFLLAKGAPVNQRMYENRLSCYEMRKAFGLGTPLHDAAASGDIDIVQLLLSKGAQVLQRDSLGQLPVERARRNGFMDVAQVLATYAKQ